MARDLLGPEGTGLLNPILEKPRRTWSKTKICCIVCAVLVLLLLIGIGGFFIYISTYKADTGDVDKWEDFLAGDTANFETMTGSYELVAFDDHYQSYLEAMGIPFFVVPLILSGKERLNITVDEAANEVTIITITDWMTRTSNFKFGEMFEMQYGKGSMSGLMYNICEQPSKTEIFCKSEEREKGWEFESLLAFSYGGLVNKRSFLNSNIVTKKYYKKDGVDTQDVRFKKATTVASVEDHSWLEFNDSEEDWLNSDDDWK